MHTAILHLRVLGLLLATLFWAGGCAPIQEPVRIPEPVSTPISETEQLDIYRNIAAVVAAHLRAGDQHAMQDEFYEALLSYKAAYAYDDRQEGLQAKIVALEDKVTRESTRLYERGRGFLTTDNERALQAFNAAVRLNPAHGEARAAYDQLREDPAMKAKLVGLEAQIRQKSASYAARPGELQALIKMNEALLSYDFKNQTAILLAPWLDKEKEQQVASYLAESEKLFAAGKLARTKAQLKKAQAMAPGNDRIQALLRKVQRQQDISYLLTLARDRLRQNDRSKAVIFVGRILALEPKHHEAREMLNEVLLARLEKPSPAATPIPEQREFISALATIRQLCLAEKNDEGAERLVQLMEEILQQEILLMLERGQALYAQKAYTDAQIIFEYVEEIDPGNELAHTFIRKIENRLETLESLQ